MLTLSSGGGTGVATSDCWPMTCTASSAQTRVRPGVSFRFVRIVASPSPDSQSTSGTPPLLRADENQDLLWALRGGKYGLGIVTEVKVRLVELDTIYAGSLFFAEDDIEAALRGWIDWTARADERASTSAAVVQFPPLDVVPEPLRGRRLLSLRFAFPGGGADGEGLAAPLRALAPVHLDALGEIPAAAIATVHNDPTDPSPSWVSGAMSPSQQEARARP